MKILKSQLQKIIKEEYQRMTEGDDWFTAAAIKQRGIENLERAIAHMKKVAAEGKTKDAALYGEFADQLEQGEIKYYASGISSRGKFGIQQYVQLPSGELFSITPGHPIHPDANRFKKPPAPELEYTPEEAEAAFESDAANARAIDADQRAYYARNPRGNWSGD